MAEQKNIHNNRELSKPVIFAHRGSSAYAPENTLAAFGLAVEQHAEAIELDAKLSADGQVVVIHDNTVDRTTDGTGAVNSLTLAELKKLDAGSRFNPNYRSEKVPTLVEVFETVGNKILINVELTNYASPTDELPDKVVELVQKYHLEASVLLSSFDFMNLIRAESYMPGIQLSLLTRQGYAPRVIQSRYIHLKPLLALHVNGYDVTPELIQAAHRKDCRVYAYTINFLEGMRHVFAAGVDGIFTSDPLMAQKVLAEFNQ